MFLNETVHPSTRNVHLCLACGPDNYEALVAFKRDSKISDDVAAELYARIEEAYPIGEPVDLKSPKQAALISKALWETERELNA